MGSNRGKRTDTTTEKIQLMKHYGIDEKELYAVWMQYLFLVSVDPAKSTIRAIEHMRMNPAIRRVAMDYFMALGLEMFTKECLEGK